MSYSCTDFADSILDALKIDVPQRMWDSPADQADLCLQKLDAMERAIDAAKKLLEKRDAEPVVFKMYLDDLQKRVDAVAEAGVPDEDEEDEEEGDEDEDDENEET